MDLAESALKISEVIRKLELPREQAICVLIYDTKVGGMVVTSNTNNLLELSICKLAVTMLEEETPTGTYVLNDEKKRD